MTTFVNLEYQEIISLITEAGLNCKAEILKKAINKTAFLRDIAGEKLYIVQDENYYKQYSNTDKIESELKCLITSIIEKSYNNLDDKDKTNIRCTYVKSFKSIFSNTFVISLMPQLKKILTEDEKGAFVKSLDKSLYELHFLNGYLDMKTKLFHERDVKLKPVTYVIPRNYKTPSKKSVNIVRKTFQQIMSNPADLKILLLITALSLAGDAIKDQTALFYLGDGSNGKSVFMDCLAIAFGDYVQVLDKQTFEKGYTKQEKILNQFLINTYIRIANINEFSDRPIDLTIFKNFCDGKITTTSLYKDGQNTIMHRAKAFNVMNLFPKLLLDGGAKRRIDAITGKSFFVDAETDVNEKKNIYLKDKELITRYTANDDILNAIVAIICEYSQMLANGEKIDTQSNENMNNTRNDILNSNDNMTDFIDSKLIITNCGDDHIAKGDMQKMYKTFNDKSLITLNQIISSLKQSSKSIAYNTNIRNEDGTRGAFIGVKFAKKIDINEDDEITVEEYTKLINKVDLQKDQIRYLIKLLVKNKIECNNEELKLYMTSEIDEVNTTTITTTTTTTTQKKINLMPPIFDDEVIIEDEYIEVEVHNQKDDKIELLESVLDDATSYIKQLEEYIERNEENNIRYSTYENKESDCESVTLEFETIHADNYDKDFDCDKVEELKKPKESDNNETFSEIITKCNFQFSSKYADRRYLNEHVEKVSDIYTNLIQEHLKVDKKNIKALVVEIPKPVLINDYYEDYFCIKFDGVKANTKDRNMIFEKAVKMIAYNDVFASIEFINSYENICTLESALEIAKKPKKKVVKEVVTEEVIIVDEEKPSIFEKPVQHDFVQIAEGVFYDTKRKKQVVTIDDDQLNNDDVLFD
jgi:hypothetical protein